MKFTISEKSEKALTYALFVLPALFLFILVIGYPILKSFYLSFTDYNIVKDQAVWGAGFKHYIKMFKHRDFWWALRNTFIVAGVSVFGQIPIGFVLAYILHRKLVRFRGFFQGMVFLPITISMIIVGLLWLKMFSSVGAVTALLRIIKGDPRYTIGIFLNKTWAMLPIGFVLLWMWTGFYMVIFLANLQRIDPSIIEAAMIDGASEAQILLKVILPLLSGTMVILSIIAMAGSFKGFALIWALTRGGPANFTEVLPIYMYRYAFRYRKYDFGCAISIVIVAICILLVILTQFIKRKLVGREI